MIEARRSSAAPALLAAIAAFAFRGAPAQVLPWPVDPPNEVHTVANTLEAYWSERFKRWRFHAGIDIRAVPYLDKSGVEPADRTLVRAIAAGKVLKVELTEPSPDNGIVVETVNGERHVYMHLAPLTIPQKLSVVGATVNVGDVLGSIDRWSYCAFDHLHFERRSADGKVLDPLESIGPRSDTTPPRIAEIRLVPHTEFKLEEESGTPVPPSGCVRLEAGSEIHALVVDQGDAGSFGTYDVGLRALSLDSRPPGGSDFFTLQALRPFDVARQEAASSDLVERLAVVRGNLKTVGGYCSAKSLWYRFRGETGDSGVLDPEALGEGIHTIRMRVVDFAGSPAEQTFRLCVGKNKFDCRGTLLVKDCEEDSGRLPSACADRNGAGLSWLVPPLNGEAVMRVCVTNRGCEPLELSGTLVVRFEVEGCEGTSCASLAEPWEDAIDGLQGDAAFVASGDAHCLEVALPSERADALSQATSGRLVVRVATEKGVFAFNGVALDPAAAEIEIHPVSADSGPP